MPKLAMTNLELEVLNAVLKALDYLDDDTHFEMLKPFMVDVLDEDGEIDDTEIPALESLEDKVRAL